MRFSILTGGAILAAILAAPQTLAQVQEGTAPCSSGVVPICYGDHANCSISAPSEIDLYRFTGVEGELVRISLAGLSGGLDPRYEILDPDGVTVVSNSCSGCSTCACSVGENFTLPSGGSYTILVSDAGANNTGAYVLNLERIPPLVPTRFIDFGVPLTVTIGHTSDHDFLTFEGVRDDLARISITGLSGGLDPAYVFYDPLGNVVDSGSCSGCSTCPCSVVSPILTLPFDGRYTLMLYDAGWNNTGNMSVTVSCLIGTCPAGPVQLGTSYCATNPNSTGNSAFMTAWGQPGATEETLFLYASDVPPSTVGIFFFGRNQTDLPLGNGRLCVGTPIYRFPPLMSCNRGELRYEPDFDALPGGQQILPGSTWNFQAWFRDGAGMTNTSDGLAITFQ